MGSPLESQVRTSRLEGIAGDLADNGNHDILSYVNDNGRVAQVDTLTTPADPASSPGADSTYSLTINGFPVTFTDDGTPTRAKVAEGVRDAINANSDINGLVVATATATTIVVTARVGGEGFTTASAVNLTLANTTANGNASPVAFGRAVMAASLGDPKAAKILNSSDITNSADAFNKIVGVTRRDKLQELGLDSNVASYAAGQTMGVVRSGRMFVDIEGAIPDFPTGSVYVRTAADGSLDKIGGFAGASGTGLVLWSNARWVRSAGTGLAVLEVF